MGDWTESYFGTLYGELYREHLMPADRALQEAAFASHVLDLGRRRVLDLAAGYGRHARLLAASNKVVALDNNQDYLQQSLRGLKASARDNLRATRGDMRSLPFKDSSFDAVVLLFNSFGYFTGSSSSVTHAGTKAQLWKLPGVFYERQLVSEDFGKHVPVSEPVAATVDAPTQGGDENFLVLHEIRRVLRRRGGLLLEAPNPGPLLAAVLKNPRRHIVTAEYEIEEEYTFDESERVLRNKSRFRMGRRVEEGEYRLRLYSRVELRAMLQQAGLHRIKLYGSYEGEPLSARHSDIMLWHAHKR